MAVDGDGDAGTGHDGAGGDGTRPARARAARAPVRTPVLAPVPAPASTSSVDDTAVRVCIRVRPRTPREVRARAAELVVDTAWDGRTARRGARIAIPAVGRSSKAWAWDGFRATLAPHEDNAALYDAVGRPLMDAVLLGGTGAVFAYGHTSSGKTHSLLGYGDEAGLYLRAAVDMIGACGAINSAAAAGSGSGSGAGPGAGACVVVRFSEIHNKRVFDLLAPASASGSVSASGSASPAAVRSECKLLEDQDGNVHVRGDPVDAGDDRWMVRPLTSVLCRSVEDVAAAVAGGVALRRSGSSTLHEQSSRSHAVLELEVVTARILDARAAAIAAEADWVAAGKHVEMIKLDLRPGNFLDALAAYEVTEAKLADARAAADAAVAEAAPLGAGGTLVVVDLAGAEHGAPALGVKQTPEERREGREINTSLFALKECIRTLGVAAAAAAAADRRSKRRGSGGGGGASGGRSGGVASKVRVPFRDSKLTMLMRRHLLATTCRTAMVACVSSVEGHASRNVSTLQYAKLVSSAVGRSTGGAVHVSSMRARMAASAAR